MLDLLTIQEVKNATGSARVECRVHEQVDAILQKTTQSQKPYYEVSLSDAAAKFTLRAWSDGPAFSQCGQLQKGQFVEIEGEFSANGNFGLEAKGWTCRLLSEEEKADLLAGPAALREKQTRDFQLIQETVSAVRDPRLKTLCELFLSDYGDRFRRTAAARNFHHARRGGLVEHTAQMMRTAKAICSVFPALNCDLLVSAILFHDSGKLWENSMPENGFTMPYDELGEMLGHISIGIELANSLWRKLPHEQWRGVEPASEDVRRHLLHMIASHHGELQFGSPVTPKTPEAWALHHIDNLDAKLEMMFAGYETAQPVAPRILDKIRPINTRIVLPLKCYEPPIVPGGDGEL